MEDPIFVPLNNWLDIELHDLPLLMRVVPELYMMVVFQCFREQFALNLPTTMRFLHVFRYLPQHFIDDFDASVAFVARLWEDFTRNPFYQQYPLRFEQMPWESIAIPWYVTSPILQEECFPRLVGQELHYTAPNAMWLNVLRHTCTVFITYEAIDQSQAYEALLAFRLVVYEHFCRHIQEGLMMRTLMPMNMVEWIDDETRRITAMYMATPGFRDSPLRLYIFFYIYDFESLRAEDLALTSAFTTRCREFMRDMTQVDWNPPQVNFQPNDRVSLNRTLPLQWEVLPPEWTEFLLRMSILSNRPVSQDLLRLFMGSMLMDQIEPPVSELVQLAQGYARAFNQITWLKALLEPTLEVFNGAPNRRYDYDHGGGGHGGLIRRPNDNPN